MSHYQEYLRFISKLQWYSTDLEYNSHLAFNYSTSTIILNLHFSLAKQKFSWRLVLISSIAILLNNGFLCLMLQLLTSDKETFMD